MDLQQLILRIGGDSSGAEKALGNVTTATNKFGGIIKSIIAGAAVAAMVKWVDTTIQLGIESERAASLLESTMKHALNSTNEQVAAVKNWAEQQERVNHFDAELLMAQMDKAIVKYGDLGTAQIAVSASQEVARLKGIDVAAAYELTSSAANGMARSLKQFGIEAKDGTTQLEYLRQILDKAKGSTDAYNKTTAGMVEGMKLSYEVMRETLGQALLPLVNTLMQKLSPIIENMTNYIIDNMPQIQSIVAKVCDAIGWTFEVVGKGIANLVNNLKDLIGWAKEAINWVGGVLANEGVNQGGVYAPVQTGGRGTINRGVVDAEVADIKKVANAYTGVAVAAIDSGVAATKASTAGADAAKKVAEAAKAAAEAIKQARQAVSDKIYTLTHTDQQNEQRALDVEYAANLKSGVDKLAAKTLYVDECNILLKKYADIAKTKEEEQTAKMQTELDKRLAAQQRYNDAVANATNSLIIKTLVKTVGWLVGVGVTGALFGWHLSESPRKALSDWLLK